MLSTEFLRVSKSEVVQIQIHPEFLNLSRRSTQSTKVSWFKKEHLREILELIKPIVLARSNQDVVLKGNGTTKDADILSGTSVRIGYKFKRKECNETCLVNPRCVSNCSSDVKECISFKTSYRFFTIYKEKLLVYVCPIDQVDSQNIMTQLHGLVGGSTGGKKPTTIGISSYFQKSPQNKTTSVSAMEPSGLSSNPAVTSETTAKTVVMTSTSSVIRTTSPTALTSTHQPVSRSKTVPNSVPETMTTNSIVPSEDLRSKIKNIIEGSGPTLKGKKKLKKKTKSEKCIPNEPRQPQLTELFTSREKNNLEKSTQNPWDQKHASKVKLKLPEVEIFSCSSSEDVNDFCPEFKPDTFDPGKLASNNRTTKSLKTYSNYRLKFNVKAMETDLKMESDTEDVPLSLDFENDDLSSFKFKNNSKRTNLTDKIKTQPSSQPSQPSSQLSSQPSSQLSSQLSSQPSQPSSQLYKKQEKKIDHFNDFFEFETDSKEETDLEDKIQKLKSSIEKNKDKIQISKSVAMEENDDDESRIIEQKIQKLKSCVQKSEFLDEDFLCDDKKLISTSDCSNLLPSINLSRCDGLRLDNRANIRLDNLTDSDCPDSSTPVMSKTKARIPVPRLSNIHCDKIIKSGIPTLLSTLHTSDSESDAEFVPHVTKTNTNKLTQRKTRKIPIIDPSDLPELPTLSSAKVVKKRKRTETKEKTARRKLRRISDLCDVSRERENGSILDYFSRLSPSKSLKGCDIEREAIEVKEDFDIKLIEELSDMPKTKDEGNLELQREILKLDEVGNLEESQIRLLVVNSEAYLRDIFQGKIQCERHEDYKRGGKDRNNLNYQVHLDLFTEEQTEVVMETLMGIFCKKHHKYLDYLLKVLLPEILIRIYMEVKGTSYTQTEEIMRN